MVPTRWIFWNIASGYIFYILAAVALGATIYGIYRRQRLWRLGKPESRLDHIGARLRSLFIDALVQRRTLRRPYAGSMHFLIFIYMLFVAVFTVPTVLGLQTDLHESSLHGSPYEYYFLFLNVFGGLAIIGTVMAAFRRYIMRPTGLDNTADDAISLALVFILLFTGFSLAGLRIAATSGVTHHPDWTLWSPVSFGFSRLAEAMGLGEDSLRGAHRLFWWGHILLVLGTVTFTFLYWSKLTHIFISPANIFFRTSRPKGALVPILDFETTGILGAANIEDYTWKQLFDLDACTRCGRRGKMLLKGVDEAAAADDAPSLTVVGEPGVTWDELWACTTCRACQEVCPVLIEHVDKIIDMRRNLVMEQARMPDTAKRALRNIEDRGHPWRGTTHTRTDWAQGLDVKTLAEDSQVDVLYWVSCTSALEERNMKVAATLGRVLKRAGVNFGILGSEESCCGEQARRIGNEYLFQVKALHNIEIFKNYNVRKIVTTCPHCYNTFKNEYPQFGGDFEVVHHVQFVADLIEEGRLKPRQEINKTVTYHDSCYLGRYNGIYELPRRVLRTVPSLRLAEMKLRRRRSFCCGGGGGHMWMEERIGRRISDIRIDHVTETGADIVATACPYCIQLFGDRIRVRGLEGSLEAVDVIELVERSLASPEPTEERAALEKIGR
jgi:Fe-S oxidoreductase/nitrate reductase gamma subunit